MHSNYKNVTDLPTVYKYIKNSEIVAFDYETAPDEEYRQEEKAALDPHKAHIVGCSFSVLQGIPLCLREKCRLKGNETG